LASQSTRLPELEHEVSPWLSLTLPTPMIVTPTFVPPASAVDGSDYNAG
jgi:hypothetical protein